MASTAIIFIPNRLHQTTNNDIIPNLHYNSSDPHYVFFPGARPSAHLNDKVFQSARALLIRPAHSITVSQSPCFWKGSNDRQEWNRLLQSHSRVTESTPVQKALSRSLISQKVTAISEAVLGAISLARALFRANTHHLKNNAATTLIGAGILITG